MRDRHAKSAAALLSGCAVGLLPFMPLHILDGLWRWPALLGCFALGMLVTFGRAAWAAGFVLGGVCAAVIIGNAAGNLRAVFYLVMLGWHLYGAAASGVVTAELGRRWQS